MNKSKWKKCGELWDQARIETTLKPTMSREHYKQAIGRMERGNMKFTLLYRIGTALKDWAEKRKGHPVIKGIGYRVRGFRS